MEEGEAIEHKMVSKAIERAQKRVEGQNFDIRKHLLDYDDVMNKQRHAIYGLRAQVLNDKETDQLVLDMFLLQAPADEQRDQDTAERHQQIRG